jgi:hypothetical protein
MIRKVHDLGLQKDQRDIFQWLKNPEILLPTIAALAQGCESSSPYSRCVMFRLSLASTFDRHHG